MTCLEWLLSIKLLDPLVVWSLKIINEVFIDEFSRDHVPYLKRHLKNYKHGASTTTISMSSKFAKVVRHHEKLPLIEFKKSSIY